jgi:hypothetical protein
MESASADRLQRLSCTQQIELGMKKRSAATTGTTTTILPGGRHHAPRIEKNVHRSTNQQQSKDLNQPQKHKNRAST